MKINEAWHRAHPMPPRASIEQRIEWHTAHVEQCGYREVPPGVAAEIRRRAKRSS